KQLSWSEALMHADTLGVASVEVSSSQKTSPEVPKNFDYHLQNGERGAVNYRLRELNQQVGAYRVEHMGADPAAWRSAFEFGKAVSTTLMIVGEDAPLDALDKLSEEFGISIAVASHKDPKALVASLASHSKRIGIEADLGGWMHENVKPVDGLAVVKDRLMAV